MAMGLCNVRPAPFLTLRPETGNSARSAAASPGRSTRNLAVTAGEDGLNVLFLELDPQSSLPAWWESQEAEATS